MSNFTLGRRLEILEQLDSTVPKNALVASEKIVVNEEKFLFHRGCYYDEWIKEHNDVLNNVISGIPIYLKMNRNGTSATYEVNGNRTIESFSYENRRISLEFSEGDILEFALIRSGRLIVCGDSPRRYISGLIVEPSGKIIKPEKNMGESCCLEKDRYLEKNILYFESDGFLKIGFSPFYGVDE